MLLDKADHKNIGRMHGGGHLGSKIILIIVHGMLQHLLKRVFLKLNLVDPRCAFEVREEISDCDTWADLRENKIKTIKEKLEKGEIGIEDEIVEYSGQTLLHQSIVINRFEVFLLCLLHRGTVRAMQPM